MVVADEPVAVGADTAAAAAVAAAAAAAGLVVLRETAHSRAIQPTACRPAEAEDKVRSYAAHHWSSRLHSATAQRPTTYH